MTYYDFLPFGWPALTFLCMLIFYKSVSRQRSGDKNIEISVLVTASAIASVIGVIMSLTYL